MTIQIQQLWPLAIPLAFAVLLAILLLRQRRIDSMHRRVMADLEASIEFGWSRLNTGLDILREQSRGEFHAPGKIVEIGDRSFVCEEGGQRFTVLLDDLPNIQYERAANPHRTGP